MLVLIIFVLFVLFAGACLALVFRADSRAESAQEGSPSPGLIDLVIGLVVVLLLVVLCWLIFYPPFAY